MWRVYYADGSTVSGRSKVHWRRAPKDGVQVVILFDPNAPIRWCCSEGPVRDRQLWTGTDTYDPFGWGVKRGSLIDDGKYCRIWERACADPAP